jgi:hypothetical protein
MLFDIDGIYFTHRLRNLKFDERLFIAAKINFAYHRSYICEPG